MESTDVCTYKRGNRPVEDVLTQGICFGIPSQKGRCCDHPIEGPPAPPFNEVCPICLEDDNNTSFLRCRHQIHMVCLMGSSRLVCPICNDDLVYMPEIVKDKIAENANRFKREEEARERQELIDAELEEDNYSPELEVMSAMSYLISMGIPLRNMGEIVLEIDEDTTRLPRGELFRYVINKVLRSIQEELNREPDEVDEDQEEESGDEIFPLVHANTSNISHLLSRMLNDQ